MSKDLVTLFNTCFNKRVYQEALLFSKCFPNWLTLPSSIGYTGNYHSTDYYGIEFRWYKEKDFKLTIGFNGSNLIYYEGIFGQDKFFGRPLFNGKIPENILEMLERFLEK